MATPRKPNILLLFVDQQRYDTIAARGDSHMITPNLDRLAREGCLFNSAYSPNPVCIPARHNLLTGLPARFHGYTINLSHPCDARLPVLPRLLADEGYDTRAIGKMHWRPVRRHHGFAKMELMEEVPRFREDDEYAMYLKSVGLGNIQNIHGVRNLLYMVPQRSLIPEEHHGTTWVGDRSVEYLRENAGRRPFFLWSSWIAPHPPFDIPDSVADIYRDAALPEPFASETPLSDRARGTRLQADLPRKSEQLRRMREVYYGAITFVDRQIGRILRALEEIGELDNTLILFTSDHGEMLGDHGCFQKSLSYDSCARIPFLVRYPERIRPGTVREEFVDLNDVLPTCLDVAGITYPGPFELPGGSIFTETKNRHYQYIENAHRGDRWIVLRDARYKYVYTFGGGCEQLFDMQRDPCESVDLLHARPNDPEVQEARRHLRAKLCEYERRWGLPGHATATELATFPVPEQTVKRNGQFPGYPANLSAAERAMMNDFGEEVLAAVRKEPLIRLHELDLDAWAQNGAPANVIERIRRERL